MTTLYDAIAPDYVAFVDQAMDEPAHILAVAAEWLYGTLGDVGGQRICDLGCGEGHLSRRMAQAGALVVGVDSSRLLLEAAARRSEGLPIRYLLEDAQSLETLERGAFDRVVSNFALMDIPDLEAVYAAVHRVLRPGGWFLFSLTHPCFQLPRFEAEGSAEEADGNAAGESYFREGFWRSDWKGGIRGRVGAHHRTLSTYLNLLIQAGFGLSRLIEPHSPGQTFPKIFLVVAERREPSHAEPGAGGGVL